MHPRDLLNLARTSKDFRALLMSRDSALFWKAAREQVPGLPECPAFLSEPQYANLLFSSFCNVRPHQLSRMRVLCADFTRWTELLEEERADVRLGVLRPVLFKLQRQTVRAIFLRARVLCL